MDSKTTLQSLAAYVHGANDVDTKVHAAVTLHVIDTIGAWIAGAHSAEGKALLSFRRQMRAQSGAAQSILTDVMTNCAVARLSEIDDIHLASMTTPGAIVIPAALTLGIAVEKDADAQAFAAAIAVGYEVMARLGAAIDGPSVLYRGIWPTLWATPIGIAAVGARLWGLSEEQTAHALAMALTFSAPGVGQPSGVTTSRWYSIGNAARDGVAAAMAAQHGFTSDLNFLDGNFMPGVYDVKPNLAAVVDGLGQPAITRTSFKPWCAARQTMAATTAFKDLRKVIDVDDIFAVEAFVLPPHLKMVDHGIVEGDRMSYLTSLPYQIAASALAPEAGFDIGKVKPFMSDALRALMAKVKVTPDESLLAEYPKAWPGRVTIAAKSGRYELALSHVPGDPDRPFDLQQVQGKFRRLLTPLIGKADCEAIFALALGTGDDDEAPGLLLRHMEKIYDTVLARPQ